MKKLYDRNGREITPDHFENEPLPKVVISKNRVTQVTACLTNFATEASDLGWPPGYWQDEMTTDLGNGQPLVFHQRDEDGGVIYKQRGSAVMVWVLNA